MVARGPPKAKAAGSSPVLIVDRMVVLGGTRVGGWEISPRCGWSTRLFVLSRGMSRHYGHVTCVCFCL